MRLACLVAVCVLACSPLSAKQHSPQAYTIQLPPSPDFQRLDWLIGIWSGKTVGAKPSGSVELSVSYDLGKRFMLFRENVSLPGSKLAPAIKEDLMGILSAGPRAEEFALNLYSSSGFVSHYQVVIKAGEIDFNPAGGALTPPGWLFRRAFKSISPAQCTEIVSVAPPDQPFFNYYTADLHRSPVNQAQAPSGPSESAAGDAQPVKKASPPAQ